MTHVRSTSLCLLVVGFACLLASGCGSAGVKANGKLLLDGKPLTVSDKGVIQMALYAEDDPKGTKAEAVDVQNDGTFVIMGKKREGVPSGKYRVAVQVFDPYPGDDKLGGKFAHDKSSLVREVKANEDLIIDLGKASN
ncbi:MAG: hypothetical protein L0Z62_21140 [Gemmataceae bacterium]|nr:hypothetical protein [Gemmataceae bacterium]